jgi:hypothetical protein
VDRVALAKTPEDLQDAGRVLRREQSDQHHPQ